MMHRCTCIRRIAKFAVTDGGGSAGGGAMATSAAGRPHQRRQRPMIPGPAWPHQRASLRSTENAAPLGPRQRYRSKMFIIVSTPNSDAGARWMYDSAASQVSTEVIRV